MNRLRIPNGNKLKWPAFASHNIIYAEAEMDSVCVSVCLCVYVCVTVMYVCECVGVKSILDLFAVGVRMKSN